MTWLVTQHARSSDGRENRTAPFIYLHCCTKFCDWPPMVGKNRAFRSTCDEHFAVCCFSLFNFCQLESPRVGTTGLFAVEILEPTILAQTSISAEGQPPLWAGNFTHCEYISAASDESQVTERLIRKKHPLQDTNATNNVCSLSSCLFNAIFFSVPLCKYLASCLRCALAVKADQRGGVATARVR